MTQRQIAHALLNPVVLRPERPSRSCVESLSLEEFFDGNQDDSSIAPNSVGCGHPGIKAFRETLLRIRSHSSVLDVRIGVHEWPFPDERDNWIAAENIYIWCKGVAIKDIKEWVAPLDPDGVALVVPASIPKYGPEISKDIQVFTAGWD